MQPLPYPQRIQLVDILRGWALLGVTMMNYVAFYYLNPGKENTGDTFTTVLDNIMTYLFATKSWTLLSLLFGYGFSVFLDKTSHTGENPSIVFLRRMLWLFAFALLNTIFFHGDILRDYAVLGILLLFFHRCRLKTIFCTGLVILLVVPLISAYLRNLQIDFPGEEASRLTPLFYSHQWSDIFHFNLSYSFYAGIINPHYLITVHLVMLLCMLTGMAAYRTAFFTRIGTSRKITPRFFLITLILAIILNISNFLLLDAKAAILSYFRFGYWANLSTMLAIGSGICWLHGSGKLTTLFSYMADIGRMTLTHYLTHCLLTAFFFSGAGLHIFNPGRYWVYPAEGLLIYMVQLFISKWWLANYNYGPAEWLWRRLTYGPAVPGLKKPALKLKVK